MIQRLSRVLGNIKGLLQFNLLDPMTRVWLFSLYIKYKTLRMFSPLLESTYKRLPLVPQEKLIWQRDYDVLIILDACRYDVFSEVIHEYFDGKLVAVKSPASVTLDWLKKVWSGRFWSDIVYVSASPMVNKRGFFRDFDARKHFLYIEEVWDWGWDEKLSTVPPERVNLGVRLVLAKLKLKKLSYKRDYKIVAHYVQPHAPYIVLRNLASLVSESSASKDIVDIALRRFGYVTGKFSMDRILLGLLKEYLKDKHKVDKVLRKAYVENLRWVLEQVAKLYSELGGRIVITTDHGELLGEHGLYFHMDIPFPELRIVPWFTIK